VQLGYDDQAKEFRVSKPLQGHFKKQGSALTKLVMEFRDFSLEVDEGDTVPVTVFEPGDFVDVIAKTKGRGFQGVVKRWNFGGGPKTHGQKGFFRRPGGIGACATPGWVDKGKKMPGQMGQKRRTVQNLEIIQVREEDNVILVKGAIPGAKGDYVVIREAKKRPKAAK
jgi:large subunit ribosomal protein L3